MRRLKDKRAIITGAASGIGRALAGLLAAERSHLILVDRHVAALDEVAARVRERGVEATVYISRRKRSVPFVPIAALCSSPPWHTRCTTHSVSPRGCWGDAGQD